MLPVPGNDLDGVIAFRDIKDVDTMVDALRAEQVERDLCIVMIETAQAVERVDEILQLTLVPDRPDRIRPAGAGSKRALVLCGPNRFVARLRRAEFPVHDLIVLEHDRSVLAADLDSTLPAGPRCGGRLDHTQRAIRKTQ